MRLLTVLAVAAGALAQPQWCGKNYQQGQPATNPGGQFVIPPASTTPLLSFRCAPALRPYVSGEDTVASIVIDAPLVNLHLDGAVPVSHLPTFLDVTVKVGGHTVATALVAPDTTGTEVSFPLALLEAQTGALDVTCTATGLGVQTSTQSKLQFLPPNTVGGNTVKFEAKSGAVLVKQNGVYEPIFPYGFYTSFDNYLATNLSLLETIKATGINTIHPIPTYTNITALGLVIDKMEELGLWLMYDMRNDYMNNTAVIEQVNRIKGSTNVLTWYTGDEPDGWQYAQNSTEIAYDLINALDGYRPVSLVLNCQDYFFPEYSGGSDIVMQDTYMIGINATFSVAWGTVCNTTLGDCGCDNCRGVFEDISDRMDEFAQRLTVLGRERTATVWTVPQGFGGPGSEYWSRIPTGAEWLVQNVLAINHGAKGSFSWDMPTSADIVANGVTPLGHALPALTPFLLSPSAAFSGAAPSRVDVGAWRIRNQALVLATNLQYFDQTVSVSLLAPFLKGKNAQLKTVLSAGGSASVDANGDVVLAMSSVGSAGFVVSW